MHRSGYYKWIDRQAAGPSVRARRHQDLLVKIRQFHTGSDGVTVHAESPRTA